MSAVDDPLAAFESALQSFAASAPSAPLQPVRARGPRLLRGLLAVLLLGLLWQVLLMVRVPVLVQLPALLPVAQALCAPLACEPVPASPALWHTNPVRWQSGPEGPVLQLELRHVAPNKQPVPRLRLTVYDARSQVLSQRLLLPSDIGAPRQLEAGRTWQGRLLVQGPNARELASAHLEAVAP